MHILLSMARSIIALIVFLSLPFVALGDSSLSDDELYRKTDIVTTSLMSPFCPGRLLHDCPSSLAADLKSKIMERLKKGESPDQILDSLITVYGEDYRSAPRMHAFGVYAWITPFAFLIIGVGILWGWLTFRSKDGAAEKASSEKNGEEPLAPEMAAKVRELLRSQE